MARREDHREQRHIYLKGREENADESREHPEFNVYGHHSEGNENLYERLSTPEHNR